MLCLLMVLLCRFFSVAIAKTDRYRGGRWLYNVDIKQFNGGKKDRQNLKCKINEHLHT